MKMYSLYILLLFAVGGIPHNIQAAAAGTGKVTVENLIFPKGMQELFSYSGQQKGKAAGWLTVNDHGKEIGKVRVRLDGSSFYNPKVKNDFKITYWGHDGNGCFDDLPKGLYEWGTPVSGWIKHTVHPAPSAGRLYKVPFIRSLAPDDNPMEWFYEIRKKSGKSKRIFWDPSKVKHVHPSKEISDIFGK